MNQEPQTWAAQKKLVWPLGHRAHTQRYLEETYFVCEWFTPHITYNNTQHTSTKQRHVAKRWPISHPMSIATKFTPSVCYRLALSPVFCKALIVIIFSWKTQIAGQQYMLIMLTVTEENPGIEPGTSVLSSAKDDAQATRPSRPHTTLFGRGIYRMRMPHTPNHLQ